MHLLPADQREEDLFINVPYPGCHFEGREILLWFSDHVVVYGSYLDVGRDRMTPLDVDGNCLLRIPLEAIDRVYTMDEVCEREDVTDLVGYAH
jgi:hypothetical protein